MDVQIITQQVKTHTPYNGTESGFKTRCLELLEDYPNFYDRNLEHGHLTGSAWIVNSSKTKTLLVHHAKLDRWLQPGGHTEAQDQSIFDTALREAKEETGLTSIKALSATIYDIDIHQIPAKGDTSAHLHYDIRFLFEAKETDMLSLSNESHAIRWFSIQEVYTLTSSSSILRMAEKMK